MGQTTEPTVIVGEKLKIYLCPYRRTLTAYACACCNVEVCLGTAAFYRISGTAVASITCFSVLLKREAN